MDVEAQQAVVNRLELVLPRCDVVLVVVHGVIVGESVSHSRVLVVNQELGAQPRRARLRLTLCTRRLGHRP